MGQAETSREGFETALRIKDEIVKKVNALDIPDTQKFSMASFIGVSLIALSLVKIEDVDAYLAHVVRMIRNVHSDLYKKEMLQ